MFVGFDTSNYTTSAAVLDGNNVTHRKTMLSVREGERGLRQSDAVFQHTVNMPELLKNMSFNSLQAVGVSDRPRNVEGSYMPCFLVGVNTATAVARSCGVPLYRTSHQVGHILAALYSADKLDWTSSRFIAFHLSGGTTEALLVTPDKDEIVKAEIIAESLDLKAGQAIDRAGVMMGYKFPCGKMLDELSKQTDAEYKITPSMKGLNCSLSGVENKAKAMLEKGASHADISKFVLTYITNTIDKMLCGISEEFGNLPVIFSGGVSSNSLLRERMINKYYASFAEPSFSLDNAAGTAIFAKMKTD
ncbi:MAG: peptidase M22 [Eubacterium sp.]|nr:peptidase M22 [Eubacterium sp.]MBR2279060.1 peptidase M22 [Eubacterium sp.]